MKTGQAFLAGILLLTALHGAQARGVSPYLPLNLSPGIERQIDRVLLLAGKPVMRRPIAAATVLDALPRACEVDRAACEEVRQYLQRFMEPVGVATLAIEGAGAAGDSDQVIPNSHGQSVDSLWRVEAQGFWQANDYILVNAGAVAYDGNATATGSFLSLGVDWAQLDIGYRDHWFSPLSDSGSIITTEAPTMPSVTLSNYDPIGPMGFNYEVFWAEMSQQRGLPIGNTTTDGKPRLAGIQLGAEPVTGYAVSLNRVAQYGGGARNKGLWSQFSDELLQKDNLTFGQFQGSNRVAALASSILFPGKVPFSVDIEYAGEDNAYAEGYRLGATNLSLGIDLPQIGNRFDANVEVSEWQNDWYVHGVYTRGLTNRGRVIGHWFGDQRIFSDAIGGDSQMATVGWRRNRNQSWRAIYRTMTLKQAWARDDVPRPYERAHSLAVSLSTYWQGFPLDLEVSAGQDVFSDSYARVQASIDLVARERPRSDTYDDAVAAGNGDVSFFVDVGANRSKTRKLLLFPEPAEPAVETTAMHVGVGVRRPVSRRNDLGVRLEIDDIDDNTMLSLRALDYRFRFSSRFALNAFFGAARYDYGLATTGYYWGAGLQLTDVLPKWDVGVDFRHHEKLNRDKTLPSDPPIPTPQTHPRIYIDVDGMAVYVSRRW